MNNNDIDPSLETLLKSFYNEKLYLIKKENVKNLTWNMQETFLNRTIHSSLYKKYPCSQKFCALFFKKLIELLEPEQEVHDDMYSILCSLMKQDSENGFYYRYYLINNTLNNVVILRETKNLILNGTTGLRTWEAALILSEWALCNKQIFTNKTILELGSGVGFTGITIAKHCLVKTMIMSDHHEDILKTINSNIQINFPNSISKQKNNFTLYENDDKIIGLVKLDWNDIKDTPMQMSPDIIIGADIVFDPSILPSLIEVFKFFDCVIYIAIVIRNEDTFNKFLNILEESQLQYETLPSPKSKHIDWNENVYNRLLKIYKLR